MLDYWVTSQVIEPTKVYECSRGGRGPGRSRAYHLFNFSSLVQIKIVADLRDSGISLQRVRYAIQRLRTERGNQWQRSWIVTDGKGLYKVTRDARAVASLLKGEKGQLVFSVIAAEPVSAHVRQELKRFPAFEHDRLDGTLRSWGQRTRSG